MQLTKGTTMKEIKPGYTRVSSILSIVPSHVDGAFTYPLQHIDKEMLSNKAYLGSNVHAAIHAHVEGDIFPLSEQEQGYFESYLKWEAASQVQCMETELRLYCDGMKVTGCIDMLGQIAGRSGSCLVDFKCTVAEDAKKWVLQATLYSLLLGNNRFGHVQSALFVRLNKNGELPTVYEYKIGNEEHIAAIATLNLYRYVTKK